MGIDLKAGGRTPNRNIKPTRTTNPYHKLLIRLYKFLARRTESSFNKTILKRLHQSNTNRYPISVSRIVKYTKANKTQDLIAVAVATVTNDARLLVVPKMTVCALRFTEKARERIVAAGGQCLTFDQLALQRPTGKNTVLLRGAKRREALRHFGPAPGAKGSHTAPYVRGKGKKQERV